MLRATPGIVYAAPLSHDEKLEIWSKPWLGTDAVIADLPFPRLIDVELAPGADVDIAALARG